jgi:hypothetical protein
VDQRRFAVEDPRGFLASIQDGAILDEIQRAPDLVSYLPSSRAWRASPRACPSRLPSFAA